MASSTFPQFSDGNVEIHFSTSDDKPSLSERWNGGADATLLNGKNHWVYELRFDKDSDIGHLPRKATSDSSSPVDTEFIPGSKGKLPTNMSEAEKELHQKRVRVLISHQDLLGAVYHVTPIFGHASFDTAKSAILELAKVAEQYGFENVVKIHIENRLRLHQAQVIERCSKTPRIMLQLATTVKSAWMFMEAAIKVIGSNETYFEEVQPKLAKLHIAELMNKKRAEFKRKLQACEFAMFCIQPRNQDANWTIHHAVDFFRQWLSERLILGQDSTLSPGYANLYRTIANNEFDLSIPAHRRSVQDSCKKHYTSCTKEQVEQLGVELKTGFTTAANIIRPILVDTTQRQEKGRNLYGALTFMGIDYDELPWLEK